MGLRLRPPSIFPADWALSQRIVFSAVALCTLILTFAYCFYLYRFPAFDERGLDNPIYTYLKTGRMAYPAYGYFDAMFVHPPTHYLVSAEFMKLGLPLFPATAMPLFILTALGTFLIATGKFSFPLAVALLLGQFSAVFIWGDLVTVRPDVHLSIAWITGLIALQAAKNCDWSSWRLFVGAAVSTYAGTLHYWGTPAFLAVAVYALWLLLSAPRSHALRGFEVMAAGCILVGGLYLTQFVIPEWDNIRSFTNQVQGQGSWQDAFNRHRESYAALDTRLFYLAPYAPSPLISQRSLVDVLLTPVLDWRIPAILIATPMLLIRRETRALAIAGAIVPFFVLFYSQGKTIGYTGYYVPEIILFFVACLMLLMTLVSLIGQVRLIRRLRSQLVTTSAIAIAVFSLAAIPVTMQSKWRFGPYNDVFDVNRAAAVDIVGPHGSVAITSIPTWYVAGGSVIWQASTELTLANPESQLNADRGSSSNREFPDIRELLSPFAAVVSDTDAWWLNWSKGAPINEWYEKRLLQMKGFIINMPYGSPLMVELLYTAAEEDPLVKGFLIERKKVLKFSETDPSGSAVGGGDELWLTVLNCPTRPKAADPRIRLMYSFPLRTEPDPNAPHLVLLGTKPEHFEEVVSTAGEGCATRDVFHGRLTETNRRELKSRLEANERYIQIFTSRALALTAMDEEK